MTPNQIVFEYVASAGLIWNIRKHNERVPEFCMRGDRRAAYRLKTVELASLLNCFNVFLRDLDHRCTRHVHCCLFWKTREVALSRYNYHKLAVCRTREVTPPYQ